MPFRGIMIFSVTERGMFKRCRRRWDYSSQNRQNLTPVIDAPALSLGLLIHEALAAWLNEPDINLKDLYMDCASKELVKVKERYFKSVGAEISLSEFSILKEAVILGISMCENYQAYYKNPLPDGFKLIAAEQQVLVKVPGTRHRLEARFDAILERLSDKRLFVFEHKTYNSRPNIKELQQNDQMLAYSWVLAKLNLGSVGGVIYNGLFKRSQPPRGSSTDDLFTREVFLRPPEELNEFELFISSELRDMGSKNVVLYPNRRWEGCWDCGFNTLCSMQSRGEDYEFYKKHNFRQRDRTEELGRINNQETQ